MSLVTWLFQMKWVNWGGGHCDWPISKWGCLIGGGLWHILINWGGRIQRIQKTMASDKKGLSNWGGIINPVLTLATSPPRWSWILWSALCYMWPAQNASRKRPCYWHSGDPGRLGGYGEKRPCYRTWGLSKRLFCMVWWDHIPDFSYLGGGNSNIFYCHPIFRGKWSNFDLRIFFQGVGKKTPTRLPICFHLNHLNQELLVGHLSPSFFGQWRPWKSAASKLMCRLNNFPSGAVAWRTWNFGREPLGSGGKYGKHCIFFFGRCIYIYMFVRFWWWIYRNFEYCT